jgi:hypothetical protein
MISLHEHSCRACVVYLFQLIRQRTWHSSTRAALSGTIPKLKTLAPSKNTENGMPVELRARRGWRDRLLSTCQAAVPTFIILMTTVSCSRPDVPEPRVGIFGPLFSSPVIDTADQQVGQRDKGQPKVQRVQPRTPASPKVAAVHAPKATSTSVSRPSKKANTPQRLNAQREEQQLFQEFLEWRKRQKQLP